MKTRSECTREAWFVAHTRLYADFVGRCFFAAAMSLLLILCTLCAMAAAQSLEVSELGSEDDRWLRDHNVNCVNLGQEGSLHILSSDGHNDTMTMDQRNAPTAECRAPHAEVNAHWLKSGVTRHQTQDSVLPALNLADSVGKGSDAWRLEALQQLRRLLQGTPTLNYDAHQSMSSSH